MNKLYQDSMAMVRKFDRSDLFITFTRNLKQPNIQNELEYYQSATERPYIVAKVFQLTVKEFIHDWTEKHVFGKVICWVYTIKQQKRRLPHLHGVFTLCSQGTGLQLLLLIMPYLQSYRIEIIRLCIVLFLKITFMDHVVYLIQGYSAWQTIVLQKNPKSFKDVTDNNSAGYTEYRRHNNFSENHVVREIRIDNRFVVP